MQVHNSLQRDDRESRCQKSTWLVQSNAATIHHLSGPGYSSRCWLSRLLFSRKLIVPYNFVALVAKDRHLGKSSLTLLTLAYLRSFHVVKNAKCLTFATALFSCSNRIAPGVSETSQLVFGECLIIHFSLFILVWALVLIFVRVVAFF